MVSFENGRRNQSFLSLFPGAKWEETHILVVETDTKVGDFKSPTANVTDTKVVGYGQNNEYNIYNLSCDLPKEVDGTSENKESDLEFKTFGGDRMNGFG
jgi:hypothetical protein